MQPIVFRPMYRRSGCLVFLTAPFLGVGVYGINGYPFISYAFMFGGGFFWLIAALETFARVVVDDFGISKYYFGRFGIRIAWKKIDSWEIRNVGLHDDDGGDSFRNRVLRINVGTYRSPFKIDNCEACRPPLETLVELLRAKLGDRETIPKR